MEDGSWSPLLVFITDYALYVAGVKSGGTEYDLLCRLPHDQLDAIAVSIIKRKREFLLLNTSKVVHKNDFG